MKNRKRGFTLVELILGIVVLSLIITISSVTFLAVKENVLEKDYNNLKTYLETKAAEYASQTNITTITVADLIKEGKVTADSSGNVNNPKTNESMNCYTIKSSFENGSYNATLSEDLGVKDDGTCKDYVQTTDYKIVIISDENNFEEIKDNWVGDNVKLGILYKDTILESDDATFRWTTNTGFASSASTVLTDVDAVGTVSYKCEISNNTREGKAEATIKIDKQAPSVNGANFDTGWTKNKEILIDANDGSGSGIIGYALVKENEECQNYQSENSFKVEEEGTYKYCVKDNVGNIADGTTKIENIDNTTPGDVIITANDNIDESSWHKADFTLKFSTSDNASGSEITYYYGTKKSSLNLCSDEVLINSDFSRKTIYVKACNQAGTCSKNISEYTVLYDNTAPSYQSGGSLGAGSVSKPTYGDNDKGSGGVTVYTCVTSGSVPTKDDSCFTESASYSYSCGTTYKLFSYAVDIAGNKSDVYTHDSTYYKSCGSSGSSGSGKSSGSSCGTTCQMQKNSEQWHQTSDPKEKERLHNENVKLSGGNYNYNSSTGTWSDKSGSTIYNVSGGSK